MDNELICNKFINQYLLRGRKFVEYACFRYGYYNAQISGKIGKKETLDMVTLSIANTNYYQCRKTFCCGNSDWGL